MKEIWKPIDGYPTCYEVSNKGNLRMNVYNKEPESILQSVSGGYYTACFYGKQPRVHILVATAFVDKPEGKNLVRHIDGNKLNNCADNLEWVSQSQLMLERYKNRQSSGVYIRWIEKDVVFTTLTSAQLCTGFPIEAMKNSANTGDACFGNHFEFVEDIGDDSVYISPDEVVELSKSLSSISQILENLIKT